MTVSNLGMYNIPSFSAIINPPQVGLSNEGFDAQSCILAVGGVVKTVVPSKGGRGRSV